MAYDIARNQTVVFGTWYSSSEFSTGLVQPVTATAETWTWKSGKWTKRAPATSPPPRTWAGMAYDEARRQIVLFGGSGPEGRGQAIPSPGPATPDTWIWDGKTWSQRTPVTSPPANAYPTTVLVYHAKLGRVVALVQGQGATTQTWSWDGKTWAQLHPSIELPRFSTGDPFGTAAYDAAHGSVVVFGLGPTQGATNDRDTWTFDGQTWARHTAPIGGPPGSTGATMAYDPSSGRIVMFGGIDAQQKLLTDTWTWDGAEWTLAHPTDRPMPRFWGRSTSDTAAGQVILYGSAFIGGRIAFNYSDVWAWAKGSWTLVQPTSIPAPPDETEAILTAASVGPGLRVSCTGASPPCMSVRGKPQLGFYAGYVVFDLDPPAGANAVCVSHVSYVGKADSGSGRATGPWHQVGVVCSPTVGQLLQLGAHAQVNVAGCANVRFYPSTEALVVSCLVNGTPVTIDDGPFATNGDSQRLWWHLQQRGWMAGDLLTAVAAA